MTEHCFHADRIRALLLDLVRERSLDSLLTLIVDRLVETGNVALARVWLRGDPDSCESCHLSHECSDRTACLHLVASAGQSLAAQQPTWKDVEGHFRRIPYTGSGKVAFIGSTGDAVEVSDVRKGSRWIANPEWAVRERICGFGGQPLLNRDENLGVLAVFARTTISSEDGIWLRMIADHAATAIANARAFEEIGRLRSRLELENQTLREEIRVAQPIGNLIGRSSLLMGVADQIRLVSRTDSNVLIHGESGTGKELIARAIHDGSRRSSQLLVTVNCAAIPHDLFESEFFGHVKGAFTGATQDRPGRFHLANGGTLFLDEITEIPLPLQSKLLRVLQEGTFERVGDHRTQKVDVRIVAATNRDLSKEVRSGRFREDLFYRVNVFPIYVPPLRDRIEDIVPLAHHFTEEISRKLGLEPFRLREKDISALERYDWPGNVRELRNVIERAIVINQGGSFEFGNLFGPSSRIDRVGAERVPQADPGSVRTYDELREQERKNVLKALEASRWRISGPHGAATRLGIKASTLTSKMKALRISRDGADDARASGPPAD